MSLPSRNHGNKLHQSRYNRNKDFATVGIFHVLSFLATCTVFIAGFLIGIFYGSLMMDSNSDDVRQILSISAPAGASPTLPEGNGWTTVDVFYGSTDHVVSLLPKDKKWFSQARQDEAILSLLKYKKNGYFVDLAANDATSLSNTYTLERDYQWKGLCVEPNPIYWYNLTHYRPNCKLVAAVVGQHRMEKVHFRYNAGDHGGIADQEFDNGPKFKKESQQEYTVSLLEIFQRYQVPRVIDYLSLDVEGAEEFIMRSFPLEKYKISLLTVERPKAGLRDLLEAHGYQQIQRMSRWGETLWAHNDTMAQLDTSQLDSFNAKKQRMMETSSK